MSKGICWRDEYGRIKTETVTFLCITALQGVLVSILIEMYHSIRLLLIARYQSGYLIASCYGLIIVDRNVIFYGLITVLKEVWGPPLFIQGALFLKNRTSKKENWNITTYKKYVKSKLCKDSSICVMVCCIESILYTYCN